jgi:nitrogen fixation/metabolism regulation signal transduction histidine kinase
VAVLAIDGRGVVRLANPAAVRLLGAAGTPVGHPAGDLGVGELVLAEPGTRVVDRVAGRSGRWQVTLGTFRESGLAQHLLVVADLSRTLREEERAAWRRITRVLGHEVKNTLAPIRSLAGTLETMLRRALPAGSLLDDVLEGLHVIGDRSAALDRFVLQYRRLTHLPPPRPAAVAVAPLLRRVAALGRGDGGARVAVQAPEGLTATFDADLVEQALLNLVKNAVEAAGAGGTVEVEAGTPGGRLVVLVRDDGPGLGNPDNLFVPFFTTKPGGSGIGLALSRQIAEAHGGRLTLVDRPDGRGALATLELPVAALAPGA